MQPSARSYAFLGERLCLDYANTVDWHASDHGEERLQTPADLLKWGQDSGTLNVQEFQHLFEQASAHPKLAQEALDRARALRETVYRIFSAISHQQSPEPIDLEALSAARLEAVAQQQLQTEDNTYRWDWLPTDDLNRVWWPVALDAAELLTSDLLPRVGECPDDRGCGWLFLDTSKAGRRRWCSMKDCGNRAKAQRHREK